MVLNLNKIKASEWFVFIFKNMLSVDFSSKYNCKNKKGLQFDIYLSPKTTYSHK